LLNEQEKNMKLYVGNLPHEVTDCHLKALFSQVGIVVKARVVTDHYTRQSKGFGYVVMAEKDAGALAIRTLNGKMINDRPLVVNEARPRDTRLGMGW